MPQKIPGFTRIISSTLKYDLNVGNENLFMPFVGLRKPAIVTTPVVVIGSAMIFLEKIVTTTDISQETAKVLTRNES